MNFVHLAYPFQMKFCFPDSLYRGIVISQYLNAIFKVADLIQVLLRPVAARRPSVEQLCLAAP